MLHQMFQWLSRGVRVREGGRKAQQRRQRRERGRRQFTRLLGVQPLEDRRLLTTYTVANLNDSGGGSLRQAILDANSNAGADTIDFQSGLSGRP